MLVYLDIQKLVRGIPQALGYLEDEMAKGQKRSNKETRKPKQPVAKAAEPVCGAAMGGVFKKA